MSVLLSITIRAPVPNALPYFTRSSKSISTVSQTFFFKRGVEEPPGMTHKRLSQPPRTPPACFSIKSRMEILISSSTTQGLFTCPDMQKSLVPWLFLRPKELNHSAPLLSMVGTSATVSTFVTVVGHP